MSHDRGAGSGVALLEVRFDVVILGVRTGHIVEVERRDVVALPGERSVGLGRVSAEPPADGLDNRRESSVWLTPFDRRPAGPAPPLVDGQTG